MSEGRGLFRRRSKGWETENVRTITGALIVFIGMLAVVALAVVAVSLLGAGNKDAVVAITTSALGIISAVVSGYLGIKATANTAEKANEKTKQATDAQTRAELTEESHNALVAAIEEELPEDQANAVKAAALTRKSKPDAPGRPTQGG
ncbi:MAG TPA: hypothetical protein VF009_10235 [Solirubrobacterales bacterium]